MNTLISQGAEALITKKDNYLIKDRIKKSYRLPEIDIRLRKTRTKKEAKLLQKAQTLIPVPKIISSTDYSISIEYLKGKKLSEHLDKLKNKLNIAEEIGKNIAILHNNNIIHGDLTTSNMIYSKNKLYFIDFGLGFESNKVEDKAVDLHLIKEALTAKHYKNARELFNSILEGYKISNTYKETLTRLKKVEKRGRYKEQY